LSSIRKVFWPAAIALGFLVFLGAAGNGSALKTASAAAGNLCALTGPTVIGEGQTYLYVGWIEDDADNDEYIVSIDNNSGSSKITSILDDNGKELSDYEEVSPTNLISDVPSIEPTDIDGDVIDMFIDEFATVVTGNPCGDSIASLLSQCVDAENDDPTYCEQTNANELSSAEQAAFVKAITDALALGENDCNDLAELGREAALAQGSKNAEIDAADDFVDEGFAGSNGQGGDAVTTVFKDGTDPNNVDATCEDFLEDLVVVDVTCITAGEFTISFSADDEDDDSMSLDVICQSPPDSSSTIARTPDSVEIVPALGNVSHSLVTVTLLEDGEQAAPGYEVDFTVDPAPSRSRVSTRLLNTLRPARSSVT
jgi:hypothetical protein